MRKTVAVLALGLLSIAPAQAVAADPDTTALRNAVTRAEVLRYEQRLNAIGLSNENQRLTASQGNFESVEYVIGELRKMGYNPTLFPYATGSAPNTWSETTAPATAPVLEQISPTPKTYVNNLKGRLLLYYGTADNNVHPSNTMQLIKALQGAGKSFEVQVGPDAGHSNVNPQRMMEFFIENLVMRAPADAARKTEDGARR